MLNPSPEFVVRGYYDAMLRGDVDDAMSFVSDDVQWTMYVDRQVIPFAGESAGRAALRERFEQMLSAWELLRYEFTTLELLGQSARAVIAVAFRFRATGDVIDGSMRLVFRIIGRQIVFADEFHDAERIRAFMALVEAHKNNH